MIPNTDKLGSPGWYFSQLALKMSINRPRLALLTRYMSGDAPLPEGAEGVKAAYKAFQKKARTNFGELVVEAVAERMTPSGFRVGDAGELSTDCDLIWSANELDVASSDVHYDMLGLASGYAIVGAPDENGIPVVTREDPLCIATMQDPLRPHKIRAGLKIYRDVAEGAEFAYLYLPGYVATAKRVSSAIPYLDEAHQLNNKPGADLSGWEWIGIEDLPYADCMPLVRFRNRQDLGEFESHTDLLDRINWMVLQRLVVTAMQAYRQRAIKGDMPEYEADADGTPKLDDDGEPIKVDYNAIFQASAGALWMVPDSVDLWESQVSDITQLLEGCKSDIRDLAAVTRTPMAMLLPDGQNQSAEGAQFAREGLVFKAVDRQKRAGYGWNQVMQLALRFMGREPVTDLETLWESAERRTLSERADAATKLSAIVPFKTLMTDVMQLSPEKAAEMETERMGDILSQGLGITPPAVTGAVQ